MSPEVFAPCRRSGRVSFFSSGCSLANLLKGSTTACSMRSKDSSGSSTSTAASKKDATAWNRNYARSSKGLAPGGGRKELAILLPLLAVSRLTAARAFSSVSTPMREWKGSVDGQSPREALHFLPLDACRLLRVRSCRGLSILSSL